MGAKFFTKKKKPPMTGGFSRYGEVFYLFFFIFSHVGISHDPSLHHQELQPQEPLFLSHAQDPDEHLLHGHHFPQSFRAPGHLIRTTADHRTTTIHGGMIHCVLAKAMIASAKIAHALVRMRHPERRNNQATISLIVAIHPQATAEKNHRNGNKSVAAAQYWAIHADHPGIFIIPNASMTHQVTIRITQSTFSHVQVLQFFMGKQ